MNGRNIKSKIENLIWSDHGSLFTATTLPFSIIYSSLAKTRAGLYGKGVFDSHRASCRVVSVGNITPGGAGKTPLVIAIARGAAARGLTAVIITRGYRGKLRAKAALVQANSDSADMGDEPVMIAAALPNVPVIKSPKRKHGAIFAAGIFRPDVIILDDAFGHLAIRRDVDIVVVDAPRGFGNGKCFPSGPLREPLSALSRASAAVITRCDAAPPEQAEKIKSTIKRQSPACEIFEANTSIAGLVKNIGEEPFSADALKGKRVVAFSGIGSPASFRSTIESIGAILTTAMNFGDHHFYSDSDLAEITGAAKSAGAEFAVTTEKDLARLGGRRPAGIEVVAPRIDMEVNDIKCLIDLIQGK